MPFFKKNFLLSLSLSRSLSLSLSLPLLERIFQKDFDGNHGHLFVEKVQGRTHL